MTTADDVTNIIPSNDTSYIRKRTLKITVGKRLLSQTILDTRGYYFANIKKEDSQDYKLLERFVSGCKELSTFRKTGQLPELDPSNAITV